MGNEYQPEVKAAVMSALLAGQSVCSVAREYKIPKGTVSSWKRKAFDEVAGVEEGSTQKKAIGDLLLEYLEANLRSLKVQAEHFGDKTWLASQSADSLAVLHGVQTDKAIRLLEALTAGEEQR